MKSQYATWVLLNILLFGAGIALGAGHYPIDFDGLRCPTYEGDTLVECFGFGAILGAVTGVVIGVGQAIFLQRRLTWGRNRSIGWVAATTAAFSLGHAIGDSAPLPQALPWSALALGLLSGFVLGALQWLAIRGALENALGWLWQSTLGFGLAHGLVGLAAVFLLDASRNTIFGWSGFVDLTIFVLLEALLVGGIWSAMTGQTIFRQRRVLALE